ncbi:TPA: hypothetical protein MII31_02420 [Klebsiella pneumoniae]|nr:hypothetical protein CWN11_16770 [Klebsiella pneumoniae]PUG96260.1 hypothetical protein DB361_27405 [Klebsiella pneumoniae]HBX3911954.1 hypothetical protein [Klebsiella pneumoniae subsp. pneumoniae]HBX8640317.1 hypothetical protein [Klebsiella pneumoniae]HBY0199517.1 hypothetical protein [Klebsiella pneumoniae]
MVLWRLSHHPARRRCACRAYGSRAHRLDRRPDKAKPPSGIKTGTRSDVERPAALRLPGLRVPRSPAEP